MILGEKVLTARNFEKFLFYLVPKNKKAESKWTAKYEQDCLDHGQCQHGRRRASKQN